MIVYEYEVNLGQKLAEMQKSNEAEQLSQQQNLELSTPMPVHAFNSLIDRTIEDKFEKAVDKTSGTANVFYNKYFRKYMKDSEAQTLTITELYESMVHERDTLRATVTRLLHQNTTFMNELAKTGQHISEK